MAFEDHPPPPSRPAFLWLLLIWFIDPPAQPIRDLYEHFAGNKKQFEIWLDLWLILWPRGGWRAETSRSTKPPGWEIQRIIYSQTLQELNLAGKIFLLWHRISFWGELGANTRSRTQTCHTPGHEGTNGGQNLYLLLHCSPGSMLNKTSNTSDYNTVHRSSHFIQSQHREWQLRHISILVNLFKLCMKSIRVRKSKWKFD